MIVVTGATGNVGSAVVGELRNAGAPVRAFVRDPAAAARLGDGVEIAVGNFDDPSSVARALAGADGVFLSTADSPAKVSQETGVIDAAVAAGVRKVVKMSTTRADAASPLPPFAWHGEIEQRLRSSGLSFVILQATFSMTNLFMAAKPVRALGKLFAPAEGARIAMIDPRDVATVAARALTSIAFDGRTLELTGPEAITYDDAAAALSAALGRSIGFVAISDEALRGELLEMGAPDWLTTHLGALFPLLRAGALAQVTDTVEAVTGSAPRTISDFARDHAAVFGERAPV